MNKDYEHQNLSRYEDTNKKNYTSYDPEKISVISQVMTIGHLLQRLRVNEINLLPSFHRSGDLWSYTKKSRFIESLLIRIPIPVFYFDARDEENWEVIDGLQRLLVLKEFVKDQNFRLTDLEFLKEYENCFWVNLPRKLQRRVEETQVTAYLFGKGTPEEVIKNVYIRINSGNTTIGD